MDRVKDFLKNRTAVRVASTLITLGLGFHFLLIGLLEVDVLAEILAFDNYSLYRLEATAIGALVLFVGYASYMQNKQAVNESLARARHKIAEEARELSEKAAEAVEQDEIEDAEVKEKSDKKEGKKGKGE